MSTLLPMAVEQVYVNKSYASFWERGQQKAKAQGVSMAVYVCRLVRADVMATGRDITPAQLAELAKETIDALAQRVEESTSS